MQCEYKDVASPAQGFGRVVSSKVAMDDKTGGSRCFGFLRFSVPDQAARAMKAMNGKQASPTCIQRIYLEHALG